MQAVDHPYLVVHSASAPGAAEAAKKLQEEEAEGLLQGTCGVCHDNLEDPVMSACQHVFCRACMMEYMEGAQGQAKCPSCEKPLSVDLSGSATVSSAHSMLLLWFSVHGGYPTRSTAQLLSPACKCHLQGAVTWGLQIRVPTWRGEGGAW